MGGSLAFFNPIVERYLSLGGKIHYHSAVSSILVENNKATGIRLKDGKEIHSDIVISSADGHSTIYQWLGGKYTSTKIDKMYNELQPFSPLVYISLGIKAPHPDIPISLTFPVKEPFFIGPDKIDTLSLKNYSYDRKLCPDGKCILIIMITSNYDHWAALKEDKVGYDAEKQRIQDHVTKEIDRIYPGISADIDVADIATPMTFARYTGNWKGSYQGWLLTKKSMVVQLPQELPGLSDFYMAGHWISPGGGLPSGLITGRSAIRKICKKEGKKFISSSSGE
jgi:phytoene dehydrogenase-like protein